MKDDLVHAPWWENRISLADFLEGLASQIRSGMYSVSSECVILTKDMATGIVNVSRWGEDDGLCSFDTLKEVAEVSRTAA